MHGHLNHMSDDLCRGLLKFAEAKPLGPEGLDWLSLHVSRSDPLEAMLFYKLVISQLIG